MDSWYELVVGESSATVGMKAEEVIHAFMTSAIKQLREAGNPEAEIFSNAPLGSDAQNRVYFFSPKAADIINDLLSDYSGRPCGEPDTTSPLLKKVWGKDSEEPYPG